MPAINVPVARKRKSLLSGRAKVWNWNGDHQVMADQREHFSLEELWAECHAAKRRRLNADDVAHIIGCNECLAMLGLCEIAKNLKQAQRMYAERLEQRSDGQKY
jgi:hypothetical protein